MRFVRPNLSALPSCNSQNPISLPDLIAFNARINPYSCFCHEADGDLSTSTTVTFEQLASAVGAVIHQDLFILNASGAAIEKGFINHTQTPVKCRPVALLMESGASLFIHIAALLTLNIPCVLLSIRLSPAAVAHLLTESKAQLLVVSGRTKSLGEASAGDVHKLGHSIKIRSARSLSQVLESTTSASLEDFLRLAVESHDNVREDDSNVLILHSSGTTGMPKLLSMAHRYLLGYATCHQLHTDVGQDVNLSTLPLFHGFGLLAPCLALSVGLTVLFPPSTKVATAEAMATLLRNFPVMSVMTVPSLLEDLVQSPAYAESVPFLQKTRFVAVGGGAIKPTVGERLESDKIPLLNHFGATELGALAPIFPPQQDYDWHYLRLRDDMNVRVVPLDEQGNSVPSIDLKPDADGHIVAKLVGSPFGWKHDFELQDRVQVRVLGDSGPHTHIRLLGRKDDMLVLANGEKVFPHLIEESLKQNDKIKAAVVFGTGRNNTGVIIEQQSHSTAEDAKEFWTAVQKANLEADQHAAVPSQDLIIITPVDKHIPLSDKGVPQRRRTFEEFSAEIDEAYRRFENAHSNLGINIQVHSEDDVENALKIIVLQCLPSYYDQASRPLKSDDDFFACGMDSTLATKFWRLLQTVTQNSKLPQLSKSSIPRDLIYRYPTIGQLREYLVHGRQLNGVTHHTSDMEKLFSKHAVPAPASTASQGHHIVLTGSTGRIASHTLADLVKNRSIARVTCLIRCQDTDDAGRTKARDGYKAIIRLLTEQASDLLPGAISKVSTLPYIAGAPGLGLSVSGFDELAASTTHVLHAAWPMSFAMRLDSFSDQLQCVQSLVSLVRRAHVLQPTRKPRLVFLSSIAAVGRHQPRAQASTVVPEIFHADETTPVPMGYAQAKWLCEKLLLQAAKAYPHDIEVTIVRVGQIAGDAGGKWNEREHIPALMRACHAIGKVPRIEGTFSWLPLSTTARVLREILLSPSRHPDLTGADWPCLICHLENPIRGSWSELLTVLERDIGIPPGTPRLAFQAWLDEAMQRDAKMEELGPFFLGDFSRLGTGGLVLDTAKGRAVSRTLRGSGACDWTLVASWFASTRRWVSLGAQ